MAHIATIDRSFRYLLFNQLVHLRNLGYDVLAISSGGPDAEFLVREGIRHIPVEMTRQPLTPFQDTKCLVALWSILRREKVAIAHTHTPKASLLGQLAARLAGVPVVVNTVHGFHFHERTPAILRPLYVAIERIGCSCATRVLSQNLEDLQVAEREGICSAEKLRYLGNGIDLSQFDRASLDSEVLSSLRKKLRIPEGSKVVGFVGRQAGRRKGFLNFLDAARRVADSFDAILLIVGEPDRGKADSVDPSTAREFGIWDRCRFIGWRPNNELPMYYALMDCLVLPSLFEGIPRAIMEASAMRVPVVATNVKGNREAVVNGTSGLLVPFGDVPALAASIAFLLAESSEAERMGAAGRRIALEQFDERLVFQRVATEYSQLLRTKGLACPTSAFTCG